MEQMTEVKAIEILKIMLVDLMGAKEGLSIKNPMYDVIQQRIEAANMSISALEKQVRKKAIMGHNIWICPTCYPTVEVVGDHTFEANRCERCGQLIFWPDQDGQKGEGN